ncbi:hypothetical protein T03_4518, partial [Trichinella britovi]
FHIDKEKLSRELCDRETRGYVFCTPLLVTDRLMLIKTKLHCSEISKKLFPDYCDRRTTERTCSNMYIHSEFSIEIDLVQDWEAVEGKCICGDYCKIVSVNQVDLFVELTREYEAWQKINRRL